MSECEHTYINNSGFKCCTHCGIAKNTHYWNEDQTYELLSRSTPPRFFRVKNQFNYKTNRKWERLLTVDRNFTTGISGHLFNEVLSILQLLPLTPERKNDVYNYILNKKFTSYQEVCEAFYKLLHIHDLPLTTKEFLEILKNGRKHDYKLLTRIKDNTKIIRKYYWYISKQMEIARKILNFSYEESQEIYKIVFDYYNLIRFKMFKASNPTTLIKNLIYYTIRERMQPNQHIFSKDSFGLKNLSFIQSIIRYLKEIKKLKLDKNFVEKLEISIRNK